MEKTGRDSTPTKLVIKGVKIDPLKPFFISSTASAIFGKWRALTPLANTVHG